VTKQAKSQPKPAIELLTLDYQLAELPSSQHRAGLAGLVLMVKWLARQPNAKGVCRLTRLDAQGLTLEMDLPGLEALFDETYGASQEEQEYSQPWKDKKGNIKPPLKEDERQETDSKTGKTKTKKVYIYPLVVPKGALLIDFDPTANGDKGIWIKLWRDMVWEILRGIPATRNPFNARADKEPTDDAAKVWDELVKPIDYSIDLPSTYFIGAQSANAEDVPFKDRARYQFLLHFWPYIAQIYVPTIINNEGKRESVGYALAIPDIAELDFFCEEFAHVMKYRSQDVSGYRPKDAIVDLAVEGALELLSKLTARLKVLAAEQTTGTLVLGIDVVHVKKEGNSIKVLGVARLDPEMSMIDEYSRIRQTLWDTTFRRQRLLNLVNHRPWYLGFDRLCSTLSIEQTLKSNSFCHDARETFKEIEDEIMENSESVNDELKKDSKAKALTCEALVYQLVSTYISKKLKSKYQLEWGKSEKGEYNEKREKVAREAFLAVRSRSGLDFIDYFASTLCSTPQYLDEEQFGTITKALYEETDKVRTLTMLALSAKG